MKRKQPRKEKPTTLIDGNWIDVNDLVKPGEIKEISPNMWVIRTGVILDPPEPIKKAGKAKSKKK